MSEFGIDLDDPNDLDEPAAPAAREAAPAKPAPAPKPVQAPTPTFTQDNTQLAGAGALGSAAAAMAAMPDLPFGPDPVPGSMERLMDTGVYTYPNGMTIALPRDVYGSIMASGGSSLERLRKLMEALDRLASAASEAAARLEATTKKKHKPFEDSIAQDLLNPPPGALGALAAKDPEAYVDLMMTGEAVIGNVKVQVPPGRMDAIMNNPNLSDAQRKQMIFDVALQHKVTLPHQAIKQQKANACVAAASEKELALSAPSSYARIAQELKDEGKSHGLKGEKLELSEENRRYIESLDGPEEDKISLRIQTAFMDLANGGDRYEAEHDRSVDAAGSSYEGIRSQDTARLEEWIGLKAITGAAFRALESAKAITDKIAAELDAALAKGFSALSVPVVMAGSPPGLQHQMVVSFVGADGTVTAHDGSSEPRQYAREAFAAMVARDDGFIGALGTLRTTTAATVRRR